MASLTNATLGCSPTDPSSAATTAPHDPDMPDQHQELPTQSLERLSHDDPSSDPRPISLSLSRFNRDCTASVVFSLQESNPTLAPWNSIYIPKHYRVPIPGQRQSSPGECDLVLKIFPRLSVPSGDADIPRSQDLITSCEKCKAKKRDIFQIVGPDPAIPSPQRLFFSTGEIRLFFKICCPPSHHLDGQEDGGYILTFELHHGKRVLMSETVRNAGSCLVPEPILWENSAPMPKTTKRKRSSSPSFESVETAPDLNGFLPRKRSMVMSLTNLISEDSSSPSIQTENSFAPAPASADPSSPTTAVVPLSPRSYEREREETTLRPRNKSLSYDDHAPSSWNYSAKESHSGSDHAEESQGKAPSSSAASALSTRVPAKAAKRRQEPPELSELGIGQRASANLHAAYVNGQMKERSKAGLATDSGVTLADGTKSKSSSSKPKPSHTCPEPDCDKSFSRLFNLRSHMRTHSKARPFVCQSCNFAFSRRHDRDRHAKKHLSEKPYKCIVCEATFVRQDALVRHLRMDGVQNACMAAMEQRSLTLGENDGGYMLAAKQQAHDEQQKEDRRDANEKQNGSHKDQQDASHQEPIKSRHANKGGDDHGQDMRTFATTEGNGVEDDEPATADKVGIRLLESIQQGAALEYRDLAPSHSEIVKNENGSERPFQSRVFSRPPSPRHDQSGVDAGYDGKTQHAYVMSVRHERRPGSQEYPADERYNSTHSSQPRSFYPSPSRSHSRSHSQSQAYGGTADHTAAGYYDQPSPAFGHPYHSAHSKYQPVSTHGHPPSYRGDGYAYSTESPPSSGPHYHGRPHPLEPRTFADHHSADPYGTHPDQTYGSGLQPWTGAHLAEDHRDSLDLEADKSIFDAAMGLLHIRASHW
ncbi:hypothetical protein BGZ70_008887 [Mortierella alpina]|uniref:C2H2-type domain-containing protein n=1 Tax=Mortierella alpina TaxID=64518 RepID=A0A9P6J2X6_MORAP|nr:hypothetical protein BGZ70_008887 [Mortierella alpina]